MFVESKQFKRNLKLFFYDKELLAMGSNDESVVLPVLDCLDNPKAVTPHTNLFSMSKENNFVAGNAVCVTVTPTQKAFIEHLLQNATDYNNYLIDALERATHFCELDLTKEQLRQDYLLRGLAEKLLLITNPKTLN